MPAMGVKKVEEGEYRDPYAQEVSLGSGTLKGVPPMPMQRGSVFARDVAQARSNNAAVHTNRG